MDTAQVVLHVKAAPVQFIPGDHGKFYAADTRQGQPFQLNIEFRGGVAPYSASVSADAPAWVSAAISADNKWVVVTGTVPSDQPVGDVNFTVSVSDSSGDSAAVAAVVPTA